MTQAALNERTDLTSPDAAGRNGASEGPPRRKRSGWKLWAAIGVAGGILALLAVNLPALFLGKSDESAGALTFQVVRSPLQVIVTADGNVESASNVEVKCRVAGGNTILWIVEDGKIVEEGEEIVKLDTSAIEDKLNSQNITYEKALSTTIQAREDLEAAKISVREYEEGTFIQDLKGDEQIQIAMENLRTAENQVKYSTRMVRKGFVSSLQREADEFAVERAKLDLDAATTKKKVLVEFTKEKTLKDLEAKREAASAHLRSEEAGLQLEKARLDRLQDQLKNCVITAPKKGMVVYANDPSRSRYGSSGGQSNVEEGAMVRESQALVRLPDLARMQVKVTIHESRIDQVHAGLPARIVIQDQEYSGKVLNVANQPQPTSWFSANVKEYATTVSIDGGSNGLKPGMTAKVTLLIASLNDVLALPVSAVVEQRGQFYCWVKTPARPERRPLKLGRTNDKLIEVVDGVKENEEVLRNPRAMVEEARQEGPFEKQSDDLKFKGDTGAVSDAAEKAKGGPTASPPEDAKRAPAGPSAAVTAGPGAASPAGLDVAGEGPRRDPAKKAGKGGFDLMQFDKNGDKKLSRDEVPEQMQANFDRFDTNKDGFIDATEIAEMRKLRGGGGRPPGAKGDAPPGGSPEEGGGPRRAGAGGPGEGR